MAEAPHERRPRMPPSRDEDRGGGGWRRFRGIGRRFWMLVALLLVLNYVTVALFAPGRER